VVDETIANALFDEVLATWLKEMLARSDEWDGPIAVLAKDDPLGVVERVRELAILRRQHRSATVPAPDFSTRPDRTFADAVTSFSRWYASGPVESGTADLIADLERLSAFFAGDPANAKFSALWRLTQPPRISMMRRKGIDLLPYDRMRAWKQALGQADGRRREQEAAEHFEKVRAAYRALIGSIAQSLVYELGTHLTGVIEAYDRRKREAAVFDFDDLLRQARLLVCENPDTRARLATAMRTCWSMNSRIPTPCRRKSYSA
jgi:hypothetical protein